MANQGILTLWASGGKRAEVSEPGWGSGLAHDLSPECFQEGKGSEFPVNDGGQLFLGPPMSLQFRQFQLQEPLLRRLVRCYLQGDTSGSPQVSQAFPVPQEYPRKVIGRACLLDETGGRCDGPVVGAVEMVIGKDPSESMLCFVAVQVQPAFTEVPTALAFVGQTRGL